jgi:hypothetical protein
LATPSTAAAAALELFFCSIELTSAKGRGLIALLSSLNT